MFFVFFSFSESKHLIGLFSSTSQYAECTVPLHLGGTTTQRANPPIAPQMTVRWLCADPPALGAAPVGLCPARPADCHRNY